MLLHAPETGMPPHKSWIGPLGRTIPPTQAWIGLISLREPTRCLKSNWGQPRAVSSRSFYV